MTNIYPIQPIAVNPTLSQHFTPTWWQRLCRRVGAAIAKPTAPAAPTCGKRWVNTHPTKKAEVQNDQL